MYDFASNAGNQLGPHIPMVAQINEYLNHRIARRTL